MRNSGNTQKVYFAGIKGLEGAEGEVGRQERSEKWRDLAEAQYRCYLYKLSSQLGTDHISQPGIRGIKFTFVTCPRSYEPEVQRLIWFYSLCYKSRVLDFPGGPVVMAPRFHCRRCGFYPWLGKILRATRHGQKKKLPWHYCSVIVPGVA